jgi:nuclear pore complex protein Nup133
MASKRPPLHALVPSSSTREPGLILLSESGEVRFWDSISSGLSGGQNYATLSLSLEVNEVMSDMRRSDVCRLFK